MQMGIKSLKKMTVVIFLLYLLCKEQHGSTG